jgi:hypothetical protein
LVWFIHSIPSSFFRLDLNPIYPGKDYKPLVVKRSDFETECERLVKRAKKVTEKALSDAKLVVFGNFYLASR